MNDFKSWDSIILMRALERADSSDETCMFLMQAQECWVVLEGLRNTNYFSPLLDNYSNESRKKTALKKINSSYAVRRFLEPIWFISANLKMLKTNWIIRIQSIEPPARHAWLKTNIYDDDKWAQKSLYSLHLQSSQLVITNVPLPR